MCMIYDNLSKIKDKFIRDALEENEELVKKNLQMILLENNVEMPLKLEELKYVDKGYSSIKVMKELDIL